MARFENEICKYLNIPAIPKRKWDGKKSFRQGVAVTNLFYGDTAYAVATFDQETDEEPRIIKVFAEETYVSVGDIFVVPSYMDVEVEEMDLDDESKQSAKVLVEEAEEVMEQQAAEPETMSEYFFDNIHNDEEAVAFIKAYNKSKRSTARVPKTHERLIMRLSVIYAEMNKQKKLI